LALLLAGLMAFPVFFQVSGSGLSLAPRFSNESTGQLILPLFYILSPVLVLFFIFRIRKLQLPVNITALIFTLFACYTFGISWGAISGQINNEVTRSISRYIQSCLPLFSALLGIQVATLYRASERHVWMFSFVKLFCYFTTSILALYAAQTLLTGSGSRFSFLADHIGPFYNPKIKRFFPSLLALAACFFISIGICKAVNHRKIFNMYLILGVIAIAGTFSFWSRTAVVMLIFGFITPLFYFKSAAKVAAYLTLGGTAFVVGITLLMTSEAEALLSFQRTINTFAFLLDAGGEENYGDDVRFVRIAFATSEMLSSPFGSGFETHEQYLFPIADIAVAENGFLDVGVRGGIIAMMSLVFLSLRGLAITHSYAKSKDSTAIAVHSVNLALIIGGLPWLHFTTEAYFSSFFWFFLSVTNCTPFIGRKLKISNMAPMTSRHF
jgi:hypothetical protein